MVPPRVVYYALRRLYPKQKPRCVDSLFDCPEHTHTSPKTTLASVIVVPAEVALMLYSFNEPSVAGSFANHVLFPSHICVVAAIASPPPPLKWTETLPPAGTNPHTVACDGAICSTIPSPGHAARVTCAIQCTSIEETPGQQIPLHGRPSYTGVPRQDTVEQMFYSLYMYGVAIVTQPAYTDMPLRMYVQLAVTRCKQTCLGKRQTGKEPRSSVRAQ